MLIAQPVRISGRDGDERRETAGNCRIAPSWSPPKQSRFPTPSMPLTFIYRPLAAS